ncbi:hypothetical protein GCM10009530_14130 [Microbispora corallina]|uniref:Winged helix DNA-binding domain-containing protein n=1 Tax=Microbispora corallina TaxID=83302 RepID=A0ABQ4FST2_9ACTN|nr:winged helix DNA-binding domain-containing protein [Microbispora corallina]GIH37890.1 hypothetical protein Mco01_08900 [Microbispora corallina]
MHQWTWQQTLSRRLEKNYLTHLAPQAVQVVSGVCGVQAQAIPAAELGVGIRTALTRADLQELINGRQLTRTCAMRGTAYLLTADELPLYMAAMRHVYGGKDAWFTRFDLTRKQAGRLFAATREILDGQTLERSELITALKQQVGDWVFTVFDETLAFFVVAAAYAGVLAYGPARGSKATFMLPQTTTSPWFGIPEEEAATELTRRYFATYGPATHADLARWLGIKSAEAGELIANLKGELQAVGVEDREAWLPYNAEEPSAHDRTHCIRLLPQYDSYILGAGPLERIVPPEAKEFIRRHKGGRYEGAAGVQVLLVDGLFAGVWERRQTSKGLDVTVKPLHVLTFIQQNTLEDEATRVAHFYGSQAVLKVDK